MKSRLVPLALLLLACEPAVEGESAPASPLLGVWHMSEVVSGDTVRAAQPGVIIFTPGHYSLTRVSANVPRPPQPMNLAQATADELRAAWQPFTANAGRWEASGNELTVRPLVAKAGQLMEPEAFITYEWAVSGDTLQLTPVRNSMGAAAMRVTWRLARAE